MSKFKWHLKGWLSPSCITANHRQCNGYMGHPVDQERRCGCECHAAARARRAAEVSRAARWRAQLVEVADRREAERALP